MVADRDDILHCVIAELLHNVGSICWQVDEAEGVAVGIGLSECSPADRSGAAFEIFDHKGSADILFGIGGKHTRRIIGARTGLIGDDHGDVFGRRPGARGSLARNGRRGGCRGSGSRRGRARRRTAACSQNQHQSKGKNSTQDLFHNVFLPLFQFINNAAPPPMQPFSLVHLAIGAGSLDRFHVNVG